MKVLTIADDFLKLNPLTTRLSQAGIEEIGLSNISTIGSLMAIEQPDLILVDGEVLGCQVLVALRKEPAAQAIPVVFLTEQVASEYTHFLTSGVTAIVSRLDGLDAAIAEICQLLL